MTRPEPRPRDAAAASAAVPAPLGLRRALAAAAAATAWRLPGRAAAKLCAFAEAERNSQLELRLAAAATTCARRRALYLRHALDEERHASAFSRRADELRASRGLAPLGPLRADAEDLFERLGEIDFLAFVHAGERRGRAQFEGYAARLGRGADRRTAALFAALVPDELRHESYTRALLVELGGGERGAKAALRRAAAWGAWRAFRRAGRAFSVAAHALAMMALYVALAPLSVVVRLARPERRGWVNRADPER